MIVSDRVYIYPPYDTKSANIITEYNDKIYYNI